jgi:hypothetical protein
MSAVLILIEGTPSGDHLFSHLSKMTFVDAHLRFKEIDSFTT